MSVELSNLNSDLINFGSGNSHVDDSIKEGVSTGSGNIILCVGPPRYMQGAVKPGLLNQIADTLGIGGRDAFRVSPIGVVGSASVTQQRPTKVVFEIGSKLHYNIPTNTSGSIALSRVFLNGKSLMKSLYSFVSVDEIKEIYGVSDDDKPGQWESSVWINMASTLFDNSIGILMWMKNNRAKNVAAYYFENCSVQGHSFALYASGTAFTESTQIIFDRAVPVDVMNPS